MRWSAIRREAWRDVVTGTARVGVLALVFGVVVGGLVVADQSAVRSLVDEAERYRAAGGSVVTITAEGRVRGEACEALGSLPGVRAAGALRQEDDGLRLATLPQSPLTLYSVTPHLPEVLSAATDGNGLVLSEDAAVSAGRTTGGALETTDGTTRLAGVYRYPSDGRRVGFGYAALDVVPPDTSAALFDECWVDAWPVDERIEPLLLTALDPSSDADADVQLSRLNATLGVSFDGSTAFRDRLTSGAWGAAAAASAVIGFVSVRLRRIAVASALHTRVPRSALGAVLALETAAWVVPVLVAAFGVTAVAAALGPPGDRATTLLLTARIVAPSAVAVFLGAGAALALTRERHLFRYVKDR